MIDQRAAGALLHPTSLPGPFGIGDLGPQVEPFLDWMVRAGLSVWQILPLGPPAIHASPYTCLSAFAGNTLLISPRLLVSDGLLEESDLQDGPPASEQVDFGAVAAWKEKLFHRAWERFRAQPEHPLARELREFVNAPAREHWLEDYVLFLALKEKHQGRPWPEWDPEVARRNPEALLLAKESLSTKIAYHCFLQMLFFRQWERVRREAHRRGIRILGDLPIYVAHDSAEVWAQPELFDLDEAGWPRAVAGVPPDYFSETGQRWGNPLYRWERMADDGYGWWIQRLESNLAVTDWVRIDHFRAFVDYWEIPAEEETAVGGRWVAGPGGSLFAALRDHLGFLPLIAEDLGDVSPAVGELRRGVGLPGMRVLQFGFDDPASTHAQHHHAVDSVVYSGTHDNETLAAWLDSLGEEGRGRLREYCGCPAGDEHKAVLRLAYASRAFLAVLPVQDILGLRAEARMNTPSKAEGNWDWRLREGQLADALADHLHYFASLYDRLPPAEK